MTSSKRKAISEDFLESNEPIESMSRVDAEILDLIEEGLQCIPSASSLLSIIQRYKVSTDDKTILTKLRYVVEGLINESGDDDDQDEGNGFHKKKQKSVVFVQVGDECIDVNRIFRITKEQSYNIHVNEPRYDIMINKNDDEGYMCNIKIPYFSRAARDKEFSKLKEKLKEQKIVFI